MQLSRCVDENHCPDADGEDTPEGDEVGKEAIHSGVKE